MRKLICTLAAMFLMGSAISCGKSKQAGSAQAKGPTTVVISPAGQGVLQLTLAPGAKLLAGNAQDPTNVLVGPKGQRFYVWSVANVTSVKQPVSAFSGLITGQFKNFKLTGTQKLTIAGSAAVQYSGTGNQAEDGDPGQAEVVLFSIGKHVLAACVHGEEVAPADRAFMLSTLRTASAPKAKTAAKPKAKPAAKPAANSGKK